MTPLDDRWYPALAAYLHICPTRGCGRLVGAGSANCCGECHLAEERGYDPDRSDVCDHRHNERQSILTGGAL